MEQAKLDAVVLPLPDRTPEEIEREMAQTREAISEKVAALETQVMGTVKTAADTITGTVEAVKNLVSTGPTAVTDTVKNSVAAVSDAVKEQLDISKRIREHPWGAVLSAAGAGFLTGFLTARRTPTVQMAALSTVNPIAAPAAQPQVPQEPGIFDQLWSKVRKEVQELAEEAYTTATTSLRENLHTQVPNLIKTTIESSTNGLHNRIQDRNLM